MSDQESVVAFDVGGANLKLVDSDGRVDSRPFPMWSDHEFLADSLSDMLRESDAAIIVATMTGELADCFRTKREGVAHIVRALQSAAGQRAIEIYLANGEFVDAEVACDHWELAAASNWHSLAKFVGSQQPWRDSILVDVGSTTCDVVPIVGGEVVAQGRTDTERLIAGELVYVGAERTSVASIVSEVPYRGRMCPIARENFATMLDVSVVLGHFEARPEDLGTADGRPATIGYAIERLGRCICGDQTNWTKTDAAVAAEYVFEKVVSMLDASLSSIARRERLATAPIVLSGHGGFLLSGSAQKSHCRMDSLEEVIGPAAARCAPAYALVKLRAMQGRE